MNQQQALDAVKAIFPDIAEHLQVESTRALGAQRGNMNMYWIWDWSGQKLRTIAFSTRSWEHALAIAKSGNEDIWPEENEPLEDEEVSL